MAENILDEGYLEILQIQYAKFWQRLLAILIDGTIFYILGKTIQFFFWADYVHLLSAISVLIYRPVMEYFYGATLGKMVLKIKVISTDRQKPTIAQIIMRNAFGILNQFIRFSFFYASFSYSLPLYPGFATNVSLPIEVIVFFIVLIIDTLVLICNRDNQALHDLLAKTIVIKS